MGARLLHLRTVLRLSLPEGEGEEGWRDPAMETVTRDKRLEMVHALVGLVELEDPDITH